MAEDRLILVVDDDPNDVALMQRAFRRHNINGPVVVLRDGAEALEYLFDNQGRSEEAGPLPVPSIMLLDLKMPRVGGLEVLRRIRSHPRTKALPVVIMTSSVEEQDVVQAYDLGCNSYIHKPVDFSHFSEAIRRVGEYWLGLNQPPIFRPSLP